MKKKKTKKQAKQIIKKAIPIGVVVPELTLFVFGDTEEVIRHTASQIAMAIQMRFHLDNFGPTSFGLEEEEF